MNTLERTTVYVGESDHWHGKPVFIALVESARKRGLPGATVQGNPTNLTKPAERGGASSH